jgi:hypothetical protein
MLTGPNDVRLEGKTGSNAQTAKSARLTRCRQRVGSAAVDLDQMETLHSPLRGHYFLGSRDAGFVITLNREWSVGHSFLGGHHNEMQIEYPYVRDLDCPNVR